MKNKFLEAAGQRVPNHELLINIVSRRVRQLTSGHRPMTLTDPKMEPMDIALKEIGEGKLGYEFATEGRAPESEPASSAL